MAGALVSIALGKLKDYAWEKFKDYAWEKFKDKAEQELSMFVDAPRELEKLSFTLQSIQACLSDAERRQVSGDNVKQWLSRLKHVAYDIEDLVEDWQISSLEDEEGNDDDGNRRKKARLSFTDHAAYRGNVAHDIKEIKERLDQIDVERQMFGFSSSAQGGDERRPVGSQRLTTSLMDESETFVGRENDRRTIMDNLVSGSSREDQGRVQVVALVGIGGLGKTTLARQIYNDPRVRNHFNTALYWVCVSDVFDEIRLTKAILEQVKKGSTSLLQLDALQKDLLEALRGKCFLLVLDDVWNDDSEKWKMLRLPLNSGAQGSRILVTTRGQKVVNIINATYIHKLQGLSDDDSWEVFKSRAFAGRTSEEYSKLKNVGREIVKKCRGVPLTITVMGSAMNSKRTKADWQNILASEIWALQEAKHKILPALWLSYINLPRQLKQCFAYCSMFPKDWVLEKDMLVRLWVAQGFIQSEGNRDIEDIGADYFDDLVTWSMFQEVNKNNKGKITCKMHDLLHDLAESIAKDEICTFYKKSEQCPIDGSNVRHSFLFCHGITDVEFKKIQISLGRATKLRTLFVDCLGPRDKFNVDIFRQARFVRALVFHNFSSRMVELPKVIDDLRHLRYLDLSGLGIVELPESMSNLRKLHRLSLNNCEKLEKLPRGIAGMVSLRHLSISYCRKLESLPEGLGQLPSLENLSISSCSKLESLPEGLGQLPSLENLSIFDCSKLESLPEGLGQLPSLENLSISYCGKLESLPVGLGQLPSLENLSIFYCFKFESLPEGLGQLSSLKNLSVSNCGKLESLPAGLGQLPSLENLSISYCFKLESLPEGLGQLPSLENLSISHCGKLESLPAGLGQLPSLENLNISHCGKLESLPAGLGQLPSLENLRIYFCYRLKYLPEGLGQLKKLKSLEVCNLDVLTRLPDSVGQLESLESLLIEKCRKLESLPQGVHHLPHLQKLTINSCPLATERYKREGGVDWPNISHIPNIVIDEEVIQ